MKVLVALHDYLPGHLGGSELHAHQVARELVRRGHDVAAAFTERDLTAPEGDVREGELDGVRTYEMVHHREYADVREAHRQRLAGEVFRAILERVGPEVVHFHHLSLWGSGAIRSAREAGARTVVTLHDYHLLCDNAVLLRADGSLCEPRPATPCTDCLGRHPVLPAAWGEPDASPSRLLERAAVERRDQHARDLLEADAVVCPSAFLAGVFRDAGLVRPDQVHVLKYGYPGELAEPRRSDPAAPLRVGYLGGLYESKGVHVLVDAFAHLRGEPCELEIHGALDWFPEYVADLRRRAEGSAVTFRGRLERERLDETLRGLDVLVVPSIWYENLPLTIQEAYRNGTPVVATDLGGMAESVEDGVSGLLFPRGDAAALADRLRRLAGDRGLLERLARGRPHVPGMEEIVDRLEGVYGGARG